jgi:hypothetical protein
MGKPRAAPPPTRRRTPPPSGALRDRITKAGTNLLRLLGARSRGGRTGRPQPSHMPPVSEGTTVSAVSR